MTTKITEQNISNLANLGVQWQAVVTASTLNASAGKGYFIDTTSNACTITITASGSATAGDTIVFKDYARKWGTNAVTFASNKFDGVDSRTPSFNTNGQTVTLVHMGATKGWSLINEDTVTGLGAAYIAATGGTITTDGDFKIHTFTGDSNFVVSNGGNSGGSNTVDYLVVAGGGGGGRDNGGGGGAGGFRYSASTYTSPASAPGHPLRSPTGLPVSAATYPVTVGGGAVGGPGSGTANAPGSKGSNSVFSTITSTGGGGGGSDGGSTYATAPTTGGSGGGLGQNSTCGTIPCASGTGNNPPTSPPQGNPGGRLNGNPNGGGGGGGAMAAGQAGSGSANGQTGGVGAGLPTAFGSNGQPSGDYRYYSGGGGGGTGQPSSGTGGSGGLGGGATGAPNNNVGSAGTANTGGGGGGGGQGVPNNAAAAGGKGIVVIRYKFQN